MEGHNSTILIGRSVAHVREHCLKSFHTLQTVVFEVDSHLGGIFLLGLVGITPDSVFGRSHWIIHCIVAIAARAVGWRCLERHSHSSNSMGTRVCVSV
jgi:hypothetical protein